MLFVPVFVIADCGDQRHHISSNKKLFIKKRSITTTTIMINYDHISSATVADDNNGSFET